MTLIGERQSGFGIICADKHEINVVAVGSRPVDVNAILGMPADGVPAGTRWQDVPETWSCPDCAATKSDFQMVEVQ